MIPATLSHRVFCRVVFSFLFLAALFDARAQKIAIFDTNGVFAVPAGVTSITVEIWGGGGGGGFASYDNFLSIGAGGGGGGGAFGKTNLNVRAGSQFVVT